MFCYGSRRPLSIGGFPIIWETRDEDGYMLLNVTMLSRTPQPRLQLRDNCWTLYGDPEHFICPPHGRLIDVKYRNGDLLRVEFVSDDSEESLLERYPHLPFVKDFNFPLVTVDIRTEIAGSGISISEKGVKTPGMTLGGMSLYTDPHHGISIG